MMSLKSCYVRTRACGPAAAYRTTHSTENGSERLSLLALTGQEHLILVNLVLRKLSRRDALLEHEVHLCKGTVLGLRKAEITPDRSEE